MSANSNGRPIPAFISTNFTRTDKVDNKSGRYYWKCNICGEKEGSKGARIQGRDNNLPRHLVDGCLDAPPDVRREARTFILGKTQSVLAPESHGNTTNIASTSGPIVPIGSLKRRKQPNSLDGYVDYPLSDAQQQQANSRFLQWLVHSNIPFLAAENPFFQLFIDTIRPSYKAPSRYALSHNLLDSESVRAQQEDIDRLKSQKRLTLLLDGWEDLLKRSLYGSVAVEVNHYPIVLALEDMTGNRGNADNLIGVIRKAMDKMEIGDGKNIIAVTTDNPTVMQAYRRKFQQSFPWVLAFPCFLHSLNTLIGEIVAYPAIKKIITQTTRIVTFFTSSHYWGGQLSTEAKQQGIKQRLKQNCESRFYALILHCLSVLSHKSVLFQVCIQPSAQRRVNGESPVASDVVEIILHQRSYWKHLEQLVRTTKFIVDAIGNIESRQASLADCMLELIRCAKLMSQLPLDPDDDVHFWQHAKQVFNRRFHAMNTKHHSLALYLHPMCHKLAITQAASGRSIEFMIKVALDIAKQWNWDKGKAARLISDMQTYNLMRSPFAGGSADGLVWWENLPVSLEEHPLKALAITILSIVPHAGDVERLFSDLGSTQSPRRCNLSVSTFESLGKIRANLNYHLHTTKAANGKQTRRQHAHMHTRTHTGINVDVAKDLEKNFTWVPPLVGHAGSEDLVGPEAISLEEIDALFSEFEQGAASEQGAVISGELGDILDGTVYSFDELDRVDEGLVPRADDETGVVAHDEQDGGGWDAALLMSSSGLDCP